jgi:hypothetical protein
MFIVFSTLDPYNYVEDTGLNEMEFYNLETDLSE